MNEQPPREPTEDAPETARPLPPRIYVASLSDYNAGRLHGCYIDANQPVEAVWTEISDMLARSPIPGTEEWAIHDYEGFGPVRLSEYQSLDTVIRIAMGITEHGPAYAAWAAHVGIDDLDTLDHFEDCYQGHWDSLESYADDLLDSLGVAETLEQAAGSLSAYIRIDVEAFARDLVLGGDLTAVEAPDGGVYLFIP